MKRGIDDPHGSRRLSRLFAAAVGVLLVITPLSGCSDGEPDPTESRSATPGASDTGQESSRPSATDPLAQAERDLRAAEDVYFAAYDAAIADPGNERVVDRLLALYVPGSAGAREIQARMAGLASRGFAGRPGPEGYFVVEDVDVSSVAEGAKATVTICAFDDGVVYDTRNKGPDGKPIVVNDAVESGRTKSNFLKQNGEWRLVGGDVVQSWKGVNRCGPRGGQG
jgi:hypothetical protein